MNRAAMAFLLLAVGICVPGCQNAPEWSNPVQPTAQTSPVAPSPGLSSVSGIVTLRSGQPVAGVRVGIYAYNEGALTADALVASTTTGADGRYSLDASHGTWIGAGGDATGYRYYEERLTGSGAVVDNIVLDPQ